jgi:GNAT superfamily N-acetyltransferase
MTTSSTSAEDHRWTIDVVTENDLVDMLPLLRAYCQFYQQTEDIPVTSDELLMSVSRALILNPKQEGIQLLVRDSCQRTPIAFATLLWTWSTLQGGRLAIMEDLYVNESFRGQGIADQMIDECARQAREHGALCLTWQTSTTNKRAQAVYDRCKALMSDRWLNYTLQL